MFLIEKGCYPMKVKLQLANYKGINPLDEIIEQRSVRNEADGLGRVREGSDQRQNSSSKRTENSANSHTGMANLELTILLLLDPRQPAYPLGCKALTRTAGEGEPPQPPEDAEHPAPRQHLFLFKKGRNLLF
ncbi:hypothetical protein AVEN_248482-1 [Araneus ventricosus]|uniref:Uncharacterized protein n=1 Tax=Araneus ventricosus TaxID=182803 RepID=A0A4Y2R200_ARAVE|nr:hypothetical protein AVEN_248482-1 [Araneus ventricosus]